jgi:hypothetical protein
MNPKENRDVNDFIVPSDKKEEPKKEIVPLSIEDDESSLGRFLVKHANEAGVLGTIVDEKQLAVIEQFMERASHGHQAALPMRCKGKRCPFVSFCPLNEANISLPEGKNCQPPGSLVLVVDKTKEYKDRHQHIPIEKLDPTKHLVVSYFCRKKSAGQSNSLKVRGQNFSLHSREYNGELITFHVNNKKYSCTSDHTCIVKWNKAGMDKFVVYLMQKGDLFRIGTTRLFCANSKSYTFSGLGSRARKEKADNMWILGLYNTNSEALLAEESFSIKAQIPKACFVATSSRQRKKTKGIYAGVTQEMLDEHHKKCQKPFDHYKKFLIDNGLSIENPLYNYKNRKLMGGTCFAFEVAACNVIPELMQMATFSSPYKCEQRGDWGMVSATREKYNGQVYSLNVEREHTYISGGIATHNCPSEKAMIDMWVRKTVTSLDIDPTDPEQAVDMDMVYELAAIELLRMRAAFHLQQEPELVSEKIVGYSPQGQPIYDDKPSMALLILERQSKTVGKLREALLATRKAQAQAGQVASDHSVRTANVVAKAREKLRERREAQKVNRAVDEAEEAEFTTDG